MWKGLDKVFRIGDVQAVEIDVHDDRSKKKITCNKRCQVDDGLDQ
jgi:hypothetical protein